MTHLIPVDIEQFSIGGILILRETKRHGVKTFQTFKAFINGRSYESVSPFVLADKILGAIGVFLAVKSEFPFGGEPVDKIFELSHELGKQIRDKQPTRTRRLNSVFVAEPEPIRT